jgi:hypothetical protein
VREKQSFFGDFLPISKKLPAACGGSFGSQENSKSKALDSRFRGNDYKEKHRRYATQLR